MPNRSALAALVCFAATSAIAPAAIVPFSQQRTVTAGSSQSASDFGAWNRSVSSNVVSTNPSTPGLIVGSVGASMTSPAITPTFIGATLSASFGALRIGSGGSGVSQFVTVFDVVGSSAAVRISYNGTFSGSLTQARIAQLELAGPITYLRNGVGVFTTDLELSPGRYTLSGQASTGAANYDGNFGTTLNFSLVEIPAPTSGAALVLAALGLRRRR